MKDVRIALIDNFIEYPGVYRIIRLYEEEVVEIIRHKAIRIVSYINPDNESLVKKLSETPFGIPKDIHRKEVWNPRNEELEIRYAILIRNNPDYGWEFYFVVFDAWDSKFVEKLGIWPPLYFMGINKMGEE